MYIYMGHMTSHSAHMISHGFSLSSHDRSYDFSLKLLIMISSMGHMTSHMISMRSHDTEAFTCSELTTANIQAKIVVFLLTAKSPITQVSPSMGSSTTTARNRVLWPWGQDKGGGEKFNISQVYISQEQGPRPGGKNFNLARNMQGPSD